MYTNQKEHHMPDIRNATFILTKDHDHLASLIIETTELDENTFSFLQCSNDGADPIVEIISGTKVDVFEFLKPVVLNLKAEGWKFIALR